MSYTEVFERFDDQNWNDSTKLSIVMDFLDRNSDTVVTPEMFEEHLCNVISFEKELE